MHVDFDKILQNNIKHPYVAGVYDCNVFAGHNFRDLLASGIDPAKIKIAIVIDDHKLWHMVAEVVEDDKTIVLDSHYTWSQTKKVLEEDVKYKWIWEGTPDNLPGTDVLGDGNGWKDRLAAAVKGDI